MLKANVPISEFDLQSSSRPDYWILTADDNPHERDDGYAVFPLRNRPDLLRVAVCIVDPSDDYYLEGVRDRTLKNVEAKYWTNVDGSRGYKPMIDTDVITRREFTKGTTRSALIGSFTVGPEKPPCEVDISFGEVEVVSNLTFRGLARRSRVAKGARRYEEASSLIKMHLGYSSGTHAHKNRSAGVTVNRGGKQPRKSGPSAITLRGSTINEAFMIALNHLAPIEAERLDMPYISRYFDVRDGTNRAWYTLTPRPHDALKLHRYSHTTSPLRRGTDLLNGLIWKKVSRGEAIDDALVADMNAMVDGANQLILHDLKNTAGQRLGEMVIPGLLEVA